MKHTEQKKNNFNQDGAQGYQNTADKGGKGRDPGWNPPLKKKNAAKPNLLRERVHAGRKHADCDPMRTRSCVGPQPGPGANSVACGNSSAPRPREDNLHAKICKKFDVQGQCRSFFLQISV